jgi:hypothetical protein
MSNTNDAEVLPQLTENVMVTGADDALDTDDAVPYIRTLWMEKSHILFNYRNEAKEE